MALITGSIFDLSEREIAFDPDDPSITREITAGTIVPYATLKIEDNQLSCSCIAVRNDGRLILHFIDLDQAQQDIIISFIERKPERELISALLTESSSP